jgi:DNA-binding NarL/FixJ family response regulator
VKTSPGSGDTLRAAIVESICIVRTSIEMVFDAEADVEILGVASSVDEALDLLPELRGRANAVVLVALELAGDRDSFWLIRAIRDRVPEVVILATGTDLNGDAISQGLFAGADGFIHKNSPADRFVEAARRAVRGELVLEGLPRGALGGIVQALDRQRAALPSLTQREVSVLSAASEGLTAREIGRRLGVSERTVTTHLHHVYRKLGANGRVAALSAAMRLGVIVPPRAEDRILVV